MTDKEQRDLMNAFDKERVGKDYRKFLELIARDVVDMDCQWASMNEDNHSGEDFSNTLMAQLAFVYKAMYRTSIKGSTFVPFHGPMKWQGYTFALLYDVCLARKLVYKGHPEEDYHIQDAYDEGLFVGWEVRFFDNIESVERYIRKHEEYTSYSLYYNGKKVPIKFGFYPEDKKIKGQRHYCPEHEFWQHKNSFIDFEGFFDVTLTSPFVPSLPYHCKVFSEKCDLLNKVIEIMTYNQLLYWTPPIGERKESSYIKVKISDGVNQVEGVLLRHPQERGHFEFIQGEEIIKKLDETEGQKLKIRMGEGPKEAN